MILSIQPKDNIVDLLHAMDINICARLCKFGHEDPSEMEKRPQFREGVKGPYPLPFFLLVDVVIVSSPFVCGVTQRSQCFTSTSIVSATCGRKSRETKNGFTVRYGTMTS